MQRVYAKNVNNRLGSEFGLPNYTRGEEILNALTHGIGIVFSVFALVFLLVSYPKNFRNVFSVSIYATTLLVLYTISTLYHSFKVSKVKSNFRKLDHCSIFLLIAGTYTPLCMLFIKGIESTIILISVWATALIGIILNSIDVNKFSKFSLACYILMGWSVVFIARTALKVLSPWQLTWLLVGGIFYTLGAVIYVLGKKIRYMHSLWHLFVLGGSISHFMVLV